MKEKQFFVYTHARPDGSIFYVGKGDEKRVKKITRTHNSYHTRIVNKYGKENIVVRSMLCRNEQHAFDLEIKMIAALRNCGVKLVNMTDGGDGTSGYSMPECVKKKHSEAAKRQFSNPESKLRLISAISNPSKETREKIGRVHKGKIVSVETRKKMSIGLKNPSEETRKKMSDSAKKRPPISEETRKKLANAEKNRPQEINEKMRLANIGHQYNLGRKHTDEAKLKVSIANKGKILSEETKAKISEAAKRQHAKRREEKEKRQLDLI